MRPKNEEGSPTGTVEKGNVTPDVFKCDLCDFTGKSQQGVVNHAGWAHTRPKKEVSASTEDANAAQGDFKCDLCDFTGKSRQSVVNHAGWAHTRTKKEVSASTEDANAAQDDFKCDLCDFTGSSRKSIATHCRWAHTRPKEEVSPSTEGVNVAQDVFKCDLCDFIGNSRKSVSIHASWAHIRNNDSGSTPKLIKKKSKADGSSPNCEVHRCDQCSYNSPKIRNLNIHKARAHCKDDISEKKVEEVSCLLTTLIGYLYYQCQCCQGAEISAAKQKGAEKNSVGPGKFEAEFLADLSKKGRNGAELFWGLNFHKITRFPVNHCNY
jgi:uncharacterized C2H2 Zn-finger protein